MSVQLLRHRFTAAQYHEMARAGVLQEDDRVELIDGEIVDMTPIGPRHMAAVNLLNRWLVTGCGERAIVQVQGAIRIGEHSEPQPDLVLLRPRLDFYRGAAAGPSEVLLVIEVADTSLPYDRSVKLSLYARAGIPEVWLVDLVRNRLEVYREPGPDGYRSVATAERDARVSPPGFADVVLSIDPLF